MVIQSVPQEYILIQIYVSHDVTGATSLLLSEKHGNLLLTSSLLYNVVPCVGKLARKSVCIRKLNLLLHFLYLMKLETPHLCPLRATPGNTISLIII